MNIRLAEEKDIQQLIRMRWDFTLEHDESKKAASYDDFAKECQVFFQKALTSGRWFIWVAEQDNEVLSHIYIELIEKVPRPGRKTNPFAYMTNMFTKKEYRNEGIGSQLLSRINQWAKDHDYEFIIVWPSDESINYYKKNGYVHCTEPMEYFPS
ncbi:GNAT family N-acetyltransferase [Peribacillus sp. SCS-155]|uniref:GNAT family N-acetyltransferase n=1 Tax=Peribacillus sedimenti TaxID=3115297 RepID=UPI003906B4BA